MFIIVWSVIQDSFDEVILVTRMLQLRHKQNSSLVTLNVYIKLLRKLSERIPFYHHIEHIVQGIVH